MDRLAGADLEVGRAQFVLDGFVIGAGEAADVGRRHGGDVIPQRPTLRTVDMKVITAGRPDAVGV
ncbi:hypothetical protein ACFRAO_05655 [Streptomyces sp. NPDC056656]|uniref:hypothetical protein n=1 Tax=Streptomyces sp. NPDC056656 TaxID=3345895 RepID=UPI0036A89512